MPTTGRQEFIPLPHCCLFFQAPTHRHHDHDKPAAPFRGGSAAVRGSQDELSRQRLASPSLRLGCSPMLQVCHVLVSLYPLSRSTSNRGFRYGLSAIAGSMAEEALACGLPGYLRGVGGFGFVVGELWLWGYFSAADSKFLGCYRCWAGVEFLWMVNEDSLCARSSWCQLPYRDRVISVLCWRV